MKVLLVKASNRVKAVPVSAQKNNEVAATDINKLLAGRTDVVLAAKISRLACLYIMFVEKGGAGKLPINIIASAVASAETGPVRGDAVIVRTSHFGAGAKYFALEDDEIQSIVDHMTKLLKAKVVLSHDA